MAQEAIAERRTQLRIRTTQPCTLNLRFSNPAGEVAELPVELFDCGGGGLGLVTTQALVLQSEVVISGEWDGAVQTQSASVRWCRPTQSGRYRMGLLLRGPVIETKTGAPHAKESQPPSTKVGAAEDYYELLQVHPKADSETLLRVYRLMAQRFHPDNKETGNRDVFEEITQAYRTLSDPGERVAYDLRTSQDRSRRWKIFDQAAASKGVPEQKRKRDGILGVLYTKRINEPDSPFMTVHEIEVLLGVAREHLEFSMWYLKEQMLIARSDSGRFSITIKGVDAAEDVQSSWQLPQSKWLAAPEV